MQKIKEGNVDPKWPPMCFLLAFHHFHPPEFLFEALHSFPPKKKNLPSKKVTKGVLNPNDLLKHQPTSRGPKHLPRVPTSS